jgi:hypothetical protein
MLDPPFGIITQFWREVFALALLFFMISPGTEDIYLVVFYKGIINKPKLTHALTDTNIGLTH